jgi:hypothetical protein
MLSSTRIILLRKFNIVKFRVRHNHTAPRGQLLGLAFTVAANNSSLIIYTLEIEKILSLYFKKLWAEIRFKYLYYEEQSLPSNSVEESSIKL